MAEKHSYGETEVVQRGSRGKGGTGVREEDDAGDGKERGSSGEKKLDGRMAGLPNGV